MKKINLYNLIIEYFSEIEDHRVDRTKKHNIFTIIFVVIFGLACGVKSWIGFADNALLNKDWLLKYLKVDLLPSKDTISRFIRTVDPIKINECFMNLVNDFVSSVKGMTVPIDGKTMSSAFKNAESILDSFVFSFFVSFLITFFFAPIATEEKSGYGLRTPILL